MFAETTTLDDIWNQLQEPGFPTVLEPGYWMLLAALDMGWHVAEPVYLQHRQPEGPRQYTFSLRHPSHPHTRKLTARAGPELDRLVHAERLRVSLCP